MSKFLVAFVGFERTSYTVNEVNEDNGTAEVCVVLGGAQAGFDINLEYETTRVTAGKSHSVR